MPPPKPKSHESKEEFLDRCMGDPMMVGEYGDEKQRYAVCLSLWKEGDRNMTTDLELRGAMAVHHTDTSTGEWDGPANQARLKNDGDEAYYRKAYAWQDPDADPNTKAAYKFIHHEVDGEGNIGPANLRACSSGIGILNGGRGGADIPDADRPGVYRHLAAHIKDAGEEAPELERGSGLGDVERRAFPLAELRVDSNAEGKPKIRGYAAVFDKWSDDLGGFREIIHPGAFSKAIKRSDVRALWNHDPNIVLGRTKSKTLTLTEDERGLAIEIIPPDWAGSYLETIQRGDVDQMSFAFQVPKGGDKWTSSGESTTREIFEAYPLFDVSPATYPAYPQTSVSVRSLLTAGGVDYDALAGALLRHQRGLTLTVEEGNLIRASIDALSRYLPAEDAQGSGKDAPPAQGSRLAILRKRLEIAARAV